MATVFVPSARVHELSHTSGISTAECLGNVFLEPDLCQLEQNVMTGPRVPAWDGSNKSLWTVSLDPLPLLHGKTPRDEISAWNGVVPTLYKIMSLCTVGPLVEDNIG